MLRSSDPQILTEVALFRTSEGGSARMCVSWDTPGHEGAMGRIRGQKGAVYESFQGLAKNLPEMKRPSLPPKVDPGGHGRSHGYLLLQVNHGLCDWPVELAINWSNLFTAGQNQGASGLFCMPRT